ncbi:hypothetical protein ACNFBR_03290 [Pseudomonas sp. NY11955]|uniref:hypothetical protein n=1 Tax=Pseudomonas sp. NY11955 TaxID=3400363 RepID=UPI003A8B6392
MKNQIRMITGIGTPIIHSSIERMAFLLVRGLDWIGAAPMPNVSKNDIASNQGLSSQSHPPYRAKCGFAPFRQGRSALPPANTSPVLRQA